jgi:hypothetical protein
MLLLISTLIILQIAFYVKENVAFMLKSGIRRLMEKSYTYRGSSYQFSSVFEDSMLSNAWYDMNGCQVLLPTNDKIPKAIIHFIGGFVVGSAPSLAYGTMLSMLADRGFLIVATPYSPIATNHDEVTLDIVQKFKGCYYSALPTLLGNSLEAIPVIGLSHSLGGKLTTLICSRKEERKLLPSRAANVFLSFNNYGIKDSNRFNKITISPQMQALLDKLFTEDLGDSIKSATMSTVGNLVKNAFSKSGLQDLLNEATITSRATKVAAGASDFLSAAVKNFGGDALTSVSKLRGTLQQFLSNDDILDSSNEFIPSPEETYQRLVNGYNVEENYLFRFASDTIDQSDRLRSWLQRRGCDAKLFTTAGDHLTPNTIISRGADASASFAGFVDSLVMVLNAVATNDWNRKNFTIGEDSDIIGRRTQKKYQLPASGYRESWDDDNM